MWTNEITLHELYDFDYTLHRLSWDPLLHLNVEERWIDVPLVLSGDRKEIVRVQAIGTIEAPRIQVSALVSELKEETLARIAHLFQWDLDLSPMQAHFTDTNLAKLFHDFPGTPIVKDFDLYFSLMKTIIHQQLNMKFAFVLSSRFAETFGERKGDVLFYPKPETIADLDYSKLRELQFSQRKAEYVIDTSRMIASGELDLQTLETEEDDAVFEKLGKVRGIGPWTIENWLLFGLGRPDLFPKADIGIQNALKAYFNIGRKPTMEEMVEWSKSWHPYRSYASMTLWRSIE